MHDSSTCCSCLLKEDKEIPAAVFRLAQRGSTQGAPDLVLVSFFFPVEHVLMLILINVCSGAGCLEYLFVEANWTNFSELSSLCAAKPLSLLL